MNASSPLREIIRSGEVVFAASFSAIGARVGGESGAAGRLGRAGSGSVMGMTMDSGGRFWATTAAGLLLRL